MPDFKKHEFAVMVDAKNDNKTLLINSVSDMEGFLYKFSSAELAQCVWDSALYNYKAGVRAGMKKVGLTPTEPKNQAPTE